MQSRDEDGKIVKSQFIDLMEAADLQDKIKQASANGAVSHTIGNLPAKGFRFTVLGLEYEVEYVDVKHRKIRAKLAGT